MNERRNALREIALRFGVDLVYVFGSRSEEVLDWIAGRRADFAPSLSDVDIGALLPGGVVWPVAEKVRFAQTFEDFFAVGRVDFVILNEADPFLAAEIIRGERLFERDGRAADEYELFVLRRAGDLAPLERERMRLVLRESL
jgi:predicted nucleotidyltransferase